MREIEAGGVKRKTEVGEVFKYIASRDHQYTLIALFNKYDVCAECVFKPNGRNLLKRGTCVGTGLDCTHRIFKSVDDVMEGL